MMKTRKASVTIMLFLILDLISILFSVGPIKANVKPPKIAVKQSVHFDGLEVHNLAEGHHNFTIQQNFFIKCKNGTCFWVQNAYIAWYDDDPCTALHVRQMWQVWAVPPGESPIATDWFADWNTISGPPFNLELDSSIAGTRLNMSGLQAGSGQPVIDVGPEAQIVDIPADTTAQDTNWKYSDTRPQLALVGPGAEVFINGSVGYPYGNLANWTEGTSGNVVPSEAYGYKADNTPDWQVDFGTILQGGRTNQTGEISDHMKWFYDPIFGHWDFGYTPDSSLERGIICYLAPEGGVGGVIIPIDKFRLLTPYILLTSTTIIGAVVVAFYVKRVKRDRKKQ